MSAKTPEGRVKEKIDAVLDRYRVYYFKPVQFGLGASGLDYHCVIRSGDIPLAFFIEAKKPGGETTPRQNLLKERLRRDYRANVFIVDGYFSLGMLEEWLQKITRADSDDTRRKASSVE